MCVAVWAAGGKFSAATAIPTGGKLRLLQLAGTIETARAETIDNCQNRWYNGKTRIGKKKFETTKKSLENPNCCKYDEKVSAIQRERINWNTQCLTAVSSLLHQTRTAKNWQFFCLLSVILATMQAIFKTMKCI